MSEKWAPACDLTALHQRAEMLSIIRSFFKKKAVLEVETPLLGHATGTDPQLDFFSSYFHCPPNDIPMYLQTSPEFAMKRLLAAGSGSIYQICKAFRNGESGSIHNPEFTILEWYEVNFSLEQLMDEVIELIKQVLQVDYSAGSINKIAYQDVFEEVTGLNPLVFCKDSYEKFAINNKLKDAINICGDNHSIWLDFIFSHQVQPFLANQPISIVYGYPAIQASLARINLKTPLIADRFEVFIKGIEIGNGFLELADPIEQEKRFNLEIETRKLNQQERVQKDPRFLAALCSGLPDCSGIALGLDRLLMLKTKALSLHDVLAFPIDRA